MLGAFTYLETVSHNYMTATVITRTENQSGQEAEDFIGKVIKIFTELDCNNLFGNLIGQTQPKQREIIKAFQTDLQKKLNISFKLNDKLGWKTEVLANEKYRDSFDLYLEIMLDDITYKVIIELDKNRADQIAKKFLSRTSHTIDNPTIYFAFCYPGTEKMSISEAKKYFSYCLNIYDKMSDERTPKKFIGLVVENNNCG